MKINHKDNSISEKLEIYTNVLVRFEINKLTDGERFLIKSIELCDIPSMKKDIEHELLNKISDELNDRTEFVWEENI